jgi:DNA-binding Lrp family transcriptional regulator
MEMQFIAPAVTIAPAWQRLKVTARAAQQHLDKLTEAGILKQVTGKRRNRVFSAERVLLSSKPTRDSAKNRNGGAGASPAPGVHPYTGGELN